MRSGADAVKHRAKSGRGAMIVLLAALHGLTGTAIATDLGEFRQSLLERGIEPALVFQGEFDSILSGGLQRSSATLGNAHLQMTLHGSQLINRPADTLYVDILSISGDRPSEFVGDSQGVSNIAAPARTRIFEAWLQHNFDPLGTSVLAGFYDVNSEFYAVQSAGLCLNGSFGIGPELSQSGHFGPSIFPQTAPTVRVAVTPKPGLVFHTALASGTPADHPGTSPALPGTRDGLILISELDWLDHASSQRQPANRRLRLGRLKTALPYENKFGAGFVVTGALPARLNDQTGLGISMARIGSHYRDQQARLMQPVAPAETAIELMHLISIDDHLALQAGLQYVMRPSANPQIAGALVGQVRIEVTL